MAKATSTESLNPALLEALQKAFGRVKIVHRGEARVTRRNRRGQRPTVVQWGEEYAVNCPICNDRGMQLRVSYHYGACGFETPRDFHLDLIHCFAEGCHKVGFNRLKSFQLVKENGYRGRLYLPAGQRHQAGSANSIDR